MKIGGRTQIPDYYRERKSGASCGGKSVRSEKGEGYIFC